MEERGARVAPQKPAAAPVKQENFFRSELIRLKAESGINDHDFYHYDTPLTVKHETETLLEAGFTRVSEVGAWGATHTLIAYKV